MAWQFPITYRRLLRMGDGDYVSGWTHELTVGTLGSEVGFRSNNYGVLSPQSIDATGINDIRVADTATTILELFAPRVAGEIERARDQRAQAATERRYRELFDGTPHLLEPCPTQDGASDGLLKGRNEPALLRR